MSFLGEAGTPIDGATINCLCDADAASNALELERRQSTNKAAATICEIETCLFTLWAEMCVFPLWDNLPYVDSPPNSMHAFISTVWSALLPAKTGLLPISDSIEAAATLDVASASVTQAVQTLETHPPEYVTEQIKDLCTQIITNLKTLTDELEHLNGMVE